MARGTRFVRRAEPNPRQPTVNGKVDRERNKKAVARLIGKHATRRTKQEFMWETFMVPVCALCYLSALRPLFCTTISSFLFCVCTCVAGSKRLVWMATRRGAAGCGLPAGCLLAAAVLVLFSGCSSLCSVCVVLLLWWLAVAGWLALGIQSVFFSIRHKKGFSGEGKALFGSIIY